jgi:methylthioribose-1-phosphate isomerase
MSTVDFQLRSGVEIPIEERSPEEVSGRPGAASTPRGVEVMNPAFDVTPHSLIDAIITEHGVARPSFDAALSTWNGKHE